MKKKPATAKRTGKSSIAIRNLLNNLKENELHYENKQITQCVFLGVLRLKPVPSAFSQVPPSTTNIIRKKLRQVKNNNNSNNVDVDKYASKTINRKIINGKVTKKNIEKVKACVKKNPVKKTIKVKFNMNRNNASSTVPKALTETSDTYTFNPVDSLFNKMKQHRLNDDGKTPENPTLFQQSSPSTSSISPLSSLSGKSTKSKKKQSPEKSNNSDKDDVIFVSQSSPTPLTTEDLYEDMVILDSPTSSKQESSLDDEIIVIDDPNPVPSVLSKEPRISPRGKKNEVDNQNVSETINLTGEDNLQVDVSTKSGSLLMQVNQTQNLSSKSESEKPKARRSRLLPALPEIFLNTRMLLRSEFTQKKEISSSKPKVKRTVKSPNYNSNSTSRLLPRKKLIEDVTDRWEIRPVSSKNHELVNHEPFGLKLKLTKTSKNCNQATSTSKNQETQTDKFNKDIEKSIVNVRASASSDFVNNNNLTKIVPQNEKVNTSQNNGDTILSSQIDEVIVIDDDDEKNVKDPVQPTVPKSKSKVLTINTSNKTDKDCIMIESTAPVAPVLESLTASGSADPVSDTSPRLLRSSYSPKKTEAPNEKHKSPQLNSNISGIDTIVDEDDFIKTPAESRNDDNRPTRTLRSSLSPRQKDKVPPLEETTVQTVQSEDKNDLPQNVISINESVDTDKTTEVYEEPATSRLLTFANPNITPLIKNDSSETSTSKTKNKEKVLSHVSVIANTLDELKQMGNLEEKRILRSSMNVLEDNAVVKSTEGDCRINENIESPSSGEMNHLIVDEKSSNKKSVVTSATNLDEITVLKKKRGRKPKEQSSRLLRSEAQISSNSEKEIETEVVVLIHDEPKQKLLPSPALGINESVESRDTNIHSEVAHQKLMKCNRADKAIAKTDHQATGNHKLLRSSSNVAIIISSSGVNGQTLKDISSKVSSPSKSPELQDLENTPDKHIEHEVSKEQQALYIESSQFQRSDVKNIPNTKQKNLNDKNDSKKKKVLDNRKKPVVKKSHEIGLEFNCLIPQSNKKMESVVISKKNRKPVTEESQSPNSVQVTKSVKGRSKVSNISKEKNVKKLVKLPTKPKNGIKIKLPIVTKSSRIKNAIKASKASVAKKNENRRLKNILVKLNKTAYPKSDKPSKPSRQAQGTVKGNKNKVDKPKKIAVKMKKLAATNVGKRTEERKISQRRPGRPAKDKKSGNKGGHIKSNIKKQVKPNKNNPKVSQKVVKKVTTKKEEFIRARRLVSKNKQEIKKSSKPSKSTRVQKISVSKSRLSKFVEAIQIESKTIQDDLIKPTEEALQINNSNTEEPEIIIRKPLKRKSKESDSNQTTQKRKILSKSEKSTPPVNGTKHDITVFDFTENELEPLPPSRFYKLKQENKSSSFENSFSNETIDLTKKEIDKVDHNFVKSKVTSSGSSLIEDISPERENNDTSNSKTKKQIISKTTNNEGSPKLSNISPSEQNIEENTDLHLSKTNNTNMVNETAKLIYKDLQKKTVEINVFSDFNRRSSRAVVLEKQNINQCTNEAQQKSKRFHIDKSLNYGKSITNKTKSPLDQEEFEQVVEDKQKSDFEKEKFYSLSTQVSDVQIDTNMETTLPQKLTVKQKLNNIPTNNYDNNGTVKMSEKTDLMNKSTSRLQELEHYNRKKSIRNFDSFEEQSTDTITETIEWVIAQSQNLTIQPAAKKIPMKRHSKKMEFSNVQHGIADTSLKINKSVSSSPTATNLSTNEKESAVLSVANEGIQLSVDISEPPVLPTMSIQKKTPTRRKSKKLQIGDGMEAREKMPDSSEIPEKMNLLHHHKEFDKKFNRNQAKGNDVCHQSPRDAPLPIESTKKPLQRQKKNPEIKSVNSKLIESEKPTLNSRGTPKKPDNDDKWLAVCGQSPKDAQHPVESASVPQSTTPSPQKSPMKQTTIIDMFKKMRQQTGQNPKRNVFAEPKRVSEVDQQNKEKAKRIKEETQLKKEQFVQRQMQSNAVNKCLERKETVHPERWERSSQSKELPARTRGQSSQREQTGQRREQSRHCNEEDELWEEDHRDPSSQREWGQSNRESLVKPKSEDLTDFLPPSQNRKERSKHCINRSREPSVHSRGEREQSACREYNRRRNSSSSYEDEDSDCESRMEWMPEEYAEYKFKYSAKKMMTCKTTFTCKICLLVFPTYYMLNKHKIKHLQVDKPYKCQQCDEAFTDVVDFNAHMRIHNGEFLFIRFKILLIVDSLKVNFVHYFFIIFLIIYSLFSF